MNNALRKFQIYLGIGGSVISLAGLGYNLWKSISKKDVNPNQVYSVEDLAKILEISQEEVLKLINNGRITAQEIGGKYKILGNNILSFLHS
ncbi:MAG: helix-turn-helix domain-containing protein [Candidatus Eremiobacterota bacterium]